MAPWDDLIHELDLWSDRGLTATLWLRDDDATTVTPALEMYLELTRACQIPAALAVIPEAADDRLASLIGAHRHISVLQHGWSHRNHAPPEDKKAEFGAHRPVDVMCADLRNGRARLNGRFDVCPVLVPPWNRISDELLFCLQEIGFTGISTFRPRSEFPAVPGLARINTHVDIIDWQGNRHFAGAGKTIETIVTHLMQRRKNMVDRDEPTGVLTHHLAHDPQGWAFLRRLFELTRAHPAVMWRDIRDALGPPK